MSGETIDITTLALRVDATEAQLAALKLDQLKESSKKAGDATDDFVKSVEREAAILGKSRTKVIEYDAAHLGLTKTQMDQVKAANAAIDAYNQHEKAMDRQRTAVMGVATAISGALIGALVAVVAMYHAASEAAGEVEREQIRLTGALRATGNAVGLTAKEIIAFAEEMAGKTFFDDEEFKKAASEMLVFKNVQGDTFKEGIKLAADMAAMYGGTVTDNVKAVGKALDNPVEGMMLLQRQFGPMSSAMKDHIKNLMDANQVGEAQGEVLKYLKERVGGMAEELNTGYTAAQKNLNKEWHEFLEDLGQTPAIGGRATESLGFLKDAVSGLRKELKGEEGGLVSKSLMAWLQGIPGIGSYIQQAQIQSMLKAKSAGKTAADYDDAEAGVAMKSADASAGAATQKAAQDAEASYNAYKKLTEVMKDTRSEMQKQVDVAGEVAKWWTQLAGDDLEKAKRQYGDLSGAIRAAWAELPEAKKRQDDYKQSIDNANKIMDESNGVNGSYKKNVADLSLLLKSGAIDLMEYALASEYLYNTQTKEGQQATKVREEMEKLNSDAMGKYREEIAKQTEELVKKADEEENNTLKLTEGQAAVYAKMLAMKELELANATAKDSEAFYTGELEKQISALKRAKAAAQVQDDTKAGNMAQKKYLEDLKRSTMELTKLADTMGDAFISLFGDKIGGALDKATHSISAFGATMGQITEDFEKGMSDATKMGMDGFDKMGDLIKRKNDETRAASIKMFADMAGAMKGFFKEHSTGYQIMSGVEKIFRVAQLAQSAINFSTQAGHIMELVGINKDALDQMLSGLVNYVMTAIGLKQAEGQASATAGVANQAGGDPYSAFFRIAAMAAIMAALGYAVGGGSGGGGVKVDISKERQKTQGTGSVLGDTDAKSQSIVNALQILRDNSSSELLYQSAMLTSLRGIESGIKGMAAMVVRLNLSNTSNLPTSHPGNWLTGGNTFDLADAGIIVGTHTRSGNVDNFASQTVGGVLSGGINASSYQDVSRTHTGSFGLHGYTADDHYYGDLGAAFGKQLTLMVRNMVDAISDAISILTDGKYSAEQIKDILKSVKIDITQISFKDLKGDDIQAALQAVFSTIGDNIVTGLLTSLPDLSALEAFQHVGEGAFETIIRVASGVERANAVLTQWGITMIDWHDIANKNGDVTTELIRQSVVAVETTAGVVSGYGQIIAAFDGSADDMIALVGKLNDLRDGMHATGLDASMLNQAMIAGAGGLSALSEGLTTYSTRFFSSAEQAAAKSSKMAADFAKLGLQMPKTREEYRHLVESITDPRLLGAVLALAPAFDDMVTSAQDAAQNLVDAWTSVADKLDKLFGGDRSQQWLIAQRNMAVGQLTATGGPFAGMDLNSLLDFFKGPDFLGVFTNLTDAQRKLVDSILGLSIDINGFSKNVEQINPAYTGNRDDMANKFLSDFDKRNSGILGSQGTYEARFGLTSKLLAEEKAKNEARMADLKKQYGGYQLPTEYDALYRSTYGRTPEGAAYGGDSIAKRQAANAKDLAHMTVLRAQYGDASQGLFDLDKWYEEQKDAIGTSLEGLAALEKVYNDKRQDILDKAITKLDDVRQSILQWRSGLLLSDLSPLTAGQRMSEALKQYQDNYALAAGGDTSALSKYQGLSESLLRESQSFYGRASPEYQKIFQDILDQSGFLGNPDGDPPTGQHLKDIKTSIDAGNAAMAAAMAKLTDRFDKLSTDLKDLSAATTDGLNDMATKIADSADAAR